ncbi:MAG: DUF1993 domain-containing protein [Burkholderiales bacterium]
MAISLYDISVLSYLQTVTAVSSFLERGLTHCQDNGIDPQSVVETRLFADMLPFRFQVQSVVHHSIGAIEAIKSGVFRPPSGLPPHTYAELQALIAGTAEALHKLTPEEVNAREGADMVFEIGGKQMPFTTEGFVQSFSLPNFHFHATTAYDILRAKGAPLGKRDYLGRMRLKK